MCNGVEHNPIFRKPQSPFCVGVRTLLHSELHLVSFFLDVEDVMNLSVAATWNGKGTGLL